MSEWISVKDRLPDNAEFCLLACRFGVRCGYKRKKEPKQRGGIWSISGSYYADDTVTHWMPMPDPPKDAA